MKFKYLILITLLGLYKPLKSQNQPIKYSKFFYTYYYPGPFSIYLGAGTSAYRGNLCGRPECNEFNPLLNIGLQYKPWPFIAFGGEIYSIKLKAFANTNQNKISFESNILEFRMFGKFYLNDDIIRKAADKRNDPIRLKFYLLTGISCIYFKPITETTTIVNNRERKRSTSSEGVTFGIPVGGGLHYYISPKFSLVGELSYMTTFSDLLDNVKGQESAQFSFLDSYAQISLKVLYSPFAKKL